MPREVSNLVVKYGYRTLIVLILLLIFSTYLLLEYFISRETNVFLLALSIIFYVITVILFIGFRLTIVDKIHKKYFHNEVLIGQKGKVLKGVNAGTKGTANVMNEDWGFICDSDTRDGDIVTVEEIMEDNVTLKVRKSS
jgi:membrane-bound ClpP family serine protease